MYKIELRTSELGISNFNNIQIRQSVYQVANSALFQAYDKNIDDLKTIKHALKKDMDVIVLIDNDIVLSGYIAAVDCGYLAKKLYLSVKINTYAGRMVGSCVGDGCHYVNIKVSSIIKDIVQPYDIKFINLSTNDFELPSFVINPTDKIENILNKLARLSDTLIYSDSQGCLVMSNKCRDRHTNSALVTGENIIDVCKNDNVYKAFESVSLHSQLPLADAYDLDKIINHSIVGKSKGSNRHYHQTVDYANSQHLASIVSELEFDCYDLQVIGSSYRTTDNKLYGLNTALNVKDAWIGLNDSFLITDIAYTYNPQGYRAILNLEEML